MPYHPKQHHRRTIRLPEYDYAEVGAYFVTICTDDRRAVFGQVIDNTVKLNTYGQIARDEWLKTAELRSNVELDTFVVMPNHLHAILFIIEPPQESDRALPSADTTSNAQVAKAGKPLPDTLGAIVGSYKSSVSREINRLRAADSAPVWQRNYFEKIIRDERMLNAIRDYITANPANWAKDEYYKR